MSAASCVSMKHTLTRLSVVGGGWWWCARLHTAVAASPHVLKSGELLLSNVRAICSHAAFFKYLFPLHESYSFRNIANSSHGRVSAPTHARTNERTNINASSQSQCVRRLPPDAFPSTRLSTHARPPRLFLMGLHNVQLGPHRYIRT